MAYKFGSDDITAADHHVRLSFNLIWKKDNSAPLVQKFVVQVEISTAA
jgi:hypothetical protein